jgi:hypothetical protein
MNASSNGEVYGSNTLYAAMVVGALVLLLGSLWTPASVSAGPSAPVQPVRVAAVAQGHVS